MDIVEEDMPLFRGTFDLIVERFGSMEGVMALTAASNYDEFVDALVG